MGGAPSGVVTGTYRYRDLPNPASKRKRFPNRLVLCIQFPNVLVAQFYSINFITLLKFNANSTLPATAFLKKIPRQIKDKYC